jgi:hypothetical protein
MKKIGSSEVDKILSTGRLLDEVGVHNWALSRDDALAALTKFAEMGIAVLGGDVYFVNNAVVELSYDNWYCNRDEHESDFAYVERSIVAARSYIEKYNCLDRKVLFAIVPKVDRV